MPQNALLIPVTQHGSRDSPSPALASHLPSPEENASALTQEECPISFLSTPFPYHRSVSKMRKMRGSMNDTSNMGVQQRSSLPFFSVCPYVVLLSRARRKGQRRAVHRLTTLVRKHDPELLGNLGYPNPLEIDEKILDRCWATKISGIDGCTSQPTIST